MADYFLVTMKNGPAWDPAKARREQHGWAEHAAFMDGILEEGLIVLGGPVGTADGDRVLVVWDAESEEAIRSRLADDPWADTVLRIESIEPWLIWLDGRSIGA
jgi:uncharacterized protein YciI